MKRKVINTILVGIGFLSFAIGTVGIFLPILPTVKFYLLALVCFAKGSKRFHQWFIGTKLYQKHLEGFVVSKHMTLKSKIIVLVSVTLLIGLAIFFIDILAMQIVMGILLVFKYYYFLFRIKTISTKKNCR